MKLERRHLTNGSSMMVALIATNFLNFLFNSILGRHLSFEDFGLVTLIITFYYVSGIFTTALAATLNFKTSQLISEGKKEDAASFFKHTVKKSLIIAALITIVWIAATPILMTFFKIDQAWLFLSFAPVFTLSTLTYAAVGYLQGQLNFQWAGGITIAEPISKVLVAFSVLALGLGYVAYLALPLSLLVSAMVGIFALFWIHSGIEKVQSTQTFPSKFYITALIAGIGSTLFFTLDILMIKHFFSAEVMGQYSLLALIGKMVFFFTTLLNIFTLPLVVRMKSQKDGKNLFLMLVGATACLGLLGWTILGLGGNYFIPLLFGEKANSILPLVSNYTLAIVLFAVSAVTVSFHLAKQEYIFAVAPVGAAIIYSLLIIFHHQNLAAITANILWTCMSLFIASMIGHLYYQKYGLVYEK